MCKYASLKVNKNIDSDSENISQVNQLNQPLLALAFQNKQAPDRSEEGV